MAQAEQKGNNTRQAIQDIVILCCALSVKLFKLKDSEYMIL